MLYHDSLRIARGLSGDAEAVVFLYDVGAVKIDPILVSKGRVGALPSRDVAPTSSQCYLGGGTDAMYVMLTGIIAQVYRRRSKIQRKQVQTAAIGWCEHGFAKALWITQYIQRRRAGSEEKSVTVQYSCRIQAHHHVHV